MALVAGIVVCRLHPADVNVWVENGDLAYEDQGRVSAVTSTSLETSVGRHRRHTGERSDAMDIVSGDLGHYIHNKETMPFTSAGVPLFVFRLRCSNGWLCAPSRGHVSVANCAVICRSSTEAHSLALRSVSTCQISRLF